MRRAHRLKQARKYHILLVHAQRSKRCLTLQMYVHLTLSTTRKYIFRIIDAAPKNPKEKTPPRGPSPVALMRVYFRRIPQAVILLVGALLSATIVWSHGLLFGVYVDLGILAVLLCLPLLLNRVQHIEFAAGRQSLLSAAAVTPLSEPALVRTLGYNLFMRPSLWFVRNNDSDYKNERLAAFLANHMESFDIMCLQEMFGLLNFRQRTLLAEADKRGFSHAAVAGAPPYLFWDHNWTFKIPFLDAGLVILSRFPIVRTDSYYYRLGNQIDGWAPKQVLWALVQLPGGTLLHVFNTHMQASYYDAPSDTSDLARAKQIEEMAAFVRRKVYEEDSGPPHPALILGDFNLDARTHNHQGPHSLDYMRMMDILTRTLSSPEHGFSARDLVFEEFKSHPITYGDVVSSGDDSTLPLAPRETVLTHTADHNCSLCIDYALFIGPRDANASVAPQETKIEPFFCPDEAGPCTQLSDHYGISSTFKVQ